MTSTTRSVRVARTSLEALDVCSVELVDPYGLALPPISAGAHIDVHLPDGSIRQYSLCNNPAESHRYELAVLRTTDSRGGSVAMHQLEVGQFVRISEPKNHFALAPGAQHSVLLAGGIGITPILCMAERLANIGSSFALHYCTRSATRTAFAERIRRSAFADRVHFYHDDQPDTEKLDIAAVLAEPRVDVHLYVCGPTSFMDWVLGSAREAGWPDERLHREYFAAAPIDPGADTDTGFEVQIASTGAVIPIAPNQTVLAALAAARIEVPSSCENRVCGTCLTHVLEGIPDHRDMFLTPDERARGDQFTPCCSRSKSARLVLDF